MIADTVLLICFAVTLASGIWAMMCDWRYMEIPNTIPVLIFAAFLVAFLCAPDAFAPWWNNWAGGLFLFVVTLILFALGVFGGGDAKLAAALAFWIGLKDLPEFFIIWGLLGGLLAMAAILIRKYKPVPAPKEGSWIATIQSGKSAIPYALPIVVGAMTALCLNVTLMKGIHQAISNFY